MDNDLAHKGIQPFARRSVRALGTVCELIVHAERDSEAMAERACEVLEDCHRELTRFEPGGTLWRLNASAGGSIRVGDEVGSLLTRCVDYAGQAEGAFSIIRRGDGFAPMHESLVIDQSRAGLLSKSLSVDLGGVAKGYAFDRVREELADLGCRSAFLHGGTSTITAIGGVPDGETPAGAGWRVLLDPGDGTHPPTVRLQDRSMSVSSQHGDRPNHIIDPRTGEPAAKCELAACIGTSAEETDAWSTALAVLGTRPESMPQHLTSVVRSGAGWAATGPDAGCIEFPSIGDES